MDVPRDERHRIASTGERPVIPDITMEQPILPKDERIVSANPSQDAAVTEPSRDVPEPKESVAGGSTGGAIPCQFTPYVPLARKTSYAGYGNNAVIWDGYPPTPVMYGDNPSMMFHSGFGFNPEMPYGQYSPFSAPFPSVMVDGQLCSAQQIPFSPAYYPQPALPNMPPGYLVPFGSFGEGNPGFGLPSPVSYPHQPMGILGSYEQSVGQRQMQGGFRLPPNSGTGRYPNGGSSYQSSNISGASSFLYKGRRSEREQDAISVSGESYAADYSRGPRAFKSKGKSIVDSGKGFMIDSDKARFFIIKSFNEDNVHKSVKYNVWTSMPNRNLKLDEAYAEAKGMTEKCPVFLFFSVNGSGQFCGLAEMIGPVDFEKDADHWHQDKWSGQFPVRWHMIKDVPNTLFRHIIMENNENKPVTHSRDSQEVNFEQGIKMLKIFKDHDARTSIIDDFDFYNERENRMLMERKSAKPPVSRFTDGSAGKVLQLDDEVKKRIPPSETDGGSRVVEGSVSIADDDTINQISEKFSESLGLEDNSDDKQVPAVTVAADSTIGGQNGSPSVI